jgi:hypothetical protein
MYILYIHWIRVYTVKAGYDNTAYEYGLYVRMFSTRSSRNDIFLVQKLRRVYEKTRIFGWRSDRKTPVGQKLPAGATTQQQAANDEEVKKRPRHRLTGRTTPSQQVNCAHGSLQQ